MTSVSTLIASSCPSCRDCVADYVCYYCGGPICADCHILVKGEVFCNICEDALLELEDDELPTCDYCGESACLDRPGAICHFCGDRVCFESSVAVGNTRVCLYHLWNICSWANKYIPQTAETYSSGVVCVACGDGEGYRTCRLCNVCEECHGDFVEVDYGRFVEGADGHLHKAFCEDIICRHHLEEIPFKSLKACPLCDDETDVHGVWNGSFYASRIMKDDEIVRTCALCNVCEDCIEQDVDFADYGDSMICHYHCRPPSSLQPININWFETRRSIARAN